MNVKSDQNILRMNSYHR